MNPPTFHKSLVLLVLFMSFGTAGCTYTRVVRDGWAPMRAMANKPTKSKEGRARSAPPTRQANWAILIAGFEGDDRNKQARRLIRDLETQAHLPDLWMEDGPNQAQVYRGRYESPDASTAPSDLRQTRMVRLDGELAFSSARLVPLGAFSPHSPGTFGHTDDLDLHRYMGMYSLQIGYYDEQGGKDFRNATEQAAKTLRKDGEEAYYYHGPNRSMVTIGLFTDADFAQEGVQRVYGPRMKSLQEKYPYNLGNGRTVIEKVNGNVIGEQPSFLVRVN